MGISIWHFLVERFGEKWLGLIPENYFTHFFEEKNMIDIEPI